MGEVISYVARMIPAQGLNKKALPDQNKIKQYLFQEEYKQLVLLRQLPTFKHESVSLLYPGCGADILFPMFYLKQLFPQLKKAQLTMIDQYHPADMIKTVLDDLGISFTEENQTIHFYWKKTLMTVFFLEDDIFKIIDRLPAFDVYFERAFRIMKDGHPKYERKIVEKLVSGGLVVSDSGFQGVPLTYYPVPSQLSAYGEMVLGVKE